MISAILTEMAKTKVNIKTINEPIKLIEETLFNHVSSNQ